MTAPEQRTPVTRLPSLSRVASICVHTSPLATLGGKDAGGMNVYVRELSIHTARLGIPVDVFTRRTNPDLPEVTQVAPGVNLVNITAGPAEPVDKNSLYQYMAQFAEEMALYGLRAGVRYDVAHAHYWLSGWAAHLVKRYWDTPFTMMFHTTAHMKNAVSPTAQHETPLRVRTERQLVSLADNIIAANPDERADLIWRQHGEAAKICTIPPGVDVGLFRPQDRDACRRELGLANDERVLLFVGRIDQIKGIDTLVDAIEVMAKRGDRVTTLLVGGDLDPDGSPVGPLAQVEAEAVRRGIVGSIRFVGSQPQDRLPTFYSAADVTVVPSRYESFGLVAVESMACRTPVVASRAGGLRFTVEDGVTGYLVEPDDANGFADAIVRVLDDPALRLQLGECAWESAQRFSWENVASSVVHVYRRLAEGYRAHLCDEEEIFA